MKALKFFVLVAFSLSGPTVTLANGSHADKGQDEVGEVNINTKKLARNTKRHHQKVKANNTGDSPSNGADKQQKTN